MRLRLLAATALALAASPALAIDDPRAEDAARLLAVMCMEHQDGGAYARTAFDNSPLAARALTPEQVTKVAGAELSGGFGWALGTPGGGDAALIYAPAQNSCVVVVRAADAASMQEALSIVVENYIDPIVIAGGQSQGSPDKTSKVEGIDVTQLGWTVAAKDGAQWLITALIAAKPNADRQHLITFTRTK